MKLRQHPAMRAFIAVAGLAVLVYANYFLRHTLEQSDTRIYSFFETFFPKVWEPLFSSSQPWWKLLVPIPELSGSWTASTLILTRLVEMRLTPPVTWYVFNALLMVASFVISWLAIRSLVFSFTLTICMGFGTQLYTTYGVPGAMSLCLLLIYFQLCLLGGFWMVVGKRPVAVWRALFALSILIMAIGYEGWLDFAAFLYLAAALLVALAYRFDRRAWLPSIWFGAAWLTVVCAVYVYVKITYGYGQVSGSESDVIFNYPTLAPKVEDFISNVVSQLYMVLTNFLPSSLVSSTAFLTLGGDELVRLQNGYHGRFAYLVVMQSLFLWRYFAGAAFVVFLFVLVRVLRRALTSGAPWVIAMALFLLMTFATGATHAIVKARPMNSMPVLGYHVLVGVLGLSLVLSLVAKQAYERRRSGVVIVAVIWGTIFYSAISRPEMLNHMAAQGGLGEALYPNPRSTLASILGYQRPNLPGLALYDPQKVTADPAPAPSTPLAGSELEPLPTMAPPLSQWTSVPGITTVATATGYRVTGNASEGGYQISSPPITVPPRHHLLARVSGTNVEGRACLGLLDGTGQRWLVRPQQGHAEIGFDTGVNTSVMLVFINCGKGRVVFDVNSVSYALLVPAAP